MQRDDRVLIVGKRIDRHTLVDEMPEARVQAVDEFLAGDVAIDDGSAGLDALDRPARQFHRRPGRDGDDVRDPRGS